MDPSLEQHATNESRLMISIKGIFWSEVDINTHFPEMMVKHRTKAVWHEIGSLFVFSPHGSDPALLSRRSSFPTHHLSGVPASWRPAAKDNKVIINDVGGWPWMKGMHFLACAAFCLNVDPALLCCHPQHCSSTWWPGDPVAGGASAPNRLWKRWRLLWLISRLSPQYPGQLVSSWCEWSDLQGKSEQPLWKEKS